MCCVNASGKRKENKRSSISYVVSIWSSSCFVFHLELAFWSNCAILKDVSLYQKRTDSTEMSLFYDSWKLNHTVTSRRDRQFNFGFAFLHTHTYFYFISWNFIELKKRSILFCSLFLSPIYHYVKNLSSYFA